MKRINRKGFAIILVASLAGLVFLLGASLVVVTRLSTASANYDQQVRLARENARTALDMAIGDLQAKLGKDTAVSYTADVYRNETADDFKAPSTGATLNVKQPFWVAGVNGTSEHWLVTQPISSDFNGLNNGTLAEPEVAWGSQTVTLLGKGTVGDRVSTLGVRVPKESIQVDELDGYTDARTIGHYAYWVGDLGTKASYALYDKTAQVDHDEYDSNKRERLGQLRFDKPVISIVNTNDDTVTPTNPFRIDSFVSDFQFRDRFGALLSPPESYLYGLTESDNEAFFHDFTPLSKGLLVNAASGGFREDLSSLTVTGDTAYDSRFLPYADLAKSAVSVASDFVDDVFPVQASGYPIAPVITQFNLNYSVYLSSSEAGDQTLYISFLATVELWNPYSSIIDLGTNSLVLEMVNLPQLDVRLDYGLGATADGKKFDLANSVINPRFEIDEIGASSNTMRPGQLSFYGKPVAVAVSESEPSLFGLGFGKMGTSVDRLEFSTGLVKVNGDVSSLFLRFTDGKLAVDSDFGLVLSVKDSLGALSSVAVYDLPGSYSLDGAEVTEIVPGTEDSVGKPSFGFSWEVGDAFLSRLEDYDPSDETLSGYHPLNPILSEADLFDFSSDSAASVNKDLTFDSSDIVVLGYNTSDFEETLKTQNDISVLQLPKQELSSVVNLSGAHKDAWVNPGVGNPNHSENDLFDRFFFSTVPGDPSDPADPTDWILTSPLPNSGYVAVAGASEVLLDSSTAAEQLFVHGMFNVHSTSIDAWTSLLKGSPSKDSAYWRTIFGDAKYLFFNYPLGGEDINGLFPSSAPTVGSNDAVRASFRTNTFALTDAEVSQLAVSIVSKIRTYVQTNGPFHSLQEFADAKIIQDAIDANSFVAVDADATGLQFLNADWVVPGSPAEFRQSTVLNLLGPYLSVRSDTFLVRAYGDAVDPASPVGSEKIWARAYCEAIVQRTHDQYGDIIAEDAADKTALDRKFEIVAFRWLSPSEI